MKTLSERIQEILKAGYRQADLVKATGLSKGAINQMKDGSIKTIQLENAQGIEKLTGFDAAWICTGKGSALTKKTKIDLNVGPADVGTRKIPLISYVQAGAMSEANEPFPFGYADTYLLTDLDLSENAFALTIKGDSMLPEFKEGDRVIIDPSVFPNPGDYVVAKNGGNEATFKKYRPRGINKNGVEIFELVPLNDDYAPMNSEVTPMRIIGTMVEHRKYRKK